MADDKPGVWVVCPCSRFRVAPTGPFVRFCPDCGGRVHADHDWQAIAGDW